MRIGWPGLAVAGVVAAFHGLAGAEAFILGGQAGALSAPGWENAYGFALVIGGATEQFEVTGQIGGYEENVLEPGREDGGTPNNLTYALLMGRYGKPMAYGLWPYLGTGIGTGNLKTGDTGKRVLILPVVEAGVKLRFLKVLQIGIALESQELRRNQIVMRVNLFLGSPKMGTDLGRYE